MYVKQKRCTFGGIIVYSITQRTERCCVARPEPRFRLSLQGEVSVLTWTCEE
jgi:hypothetical protein